MAAFSQIKHTIISSGLTYSPAELTVSLGDTVEFNVGATHPTLQVSEQTWNSNGVTALENGFDFQSGSGTVVIANSNTIYYVCTSHISSGMKGKITVSATSVVPLFTEQTLFEIYPNPVTDNRISIVFKDKVPKNLKINIFDMTGKKINSASTILSYSENTLFLELDNFEKGLYFVEIVSDTYTKATKLIVN